MQSNGEQWRFWDAVRAEMRATWWGRWLWLGLGAGCVFGTIVWWLENLRWEWPFELIPALVFWPPVWLGSDLLSLRFAGNPDPLREWWPAEFLARFIGRVGPLIGVLCVPVAALSLAETTFIIVNGPSRVDAVAWAGLTFMLLAAAVCHAAVAALVSSLSRRPRRWLITTLLGCAGYILVERRRLFGFDPWMGYVPAPNWPTWPRPQSPLHALRTAPLVDYPPEGAWGMAIVYVGIATLAGLLAWWIAARRYRRSRVLPGAE